MTGVNGDYLFAERRSNVIRRLQAEGITVTPDDFGRQGDYPTLDGMDATEWFEALTERDWVTNQEIPQS
jgi:hypothetical protein